MADRDMALMAHLLRRAGFGATREELEAYVAKGYEATVEELLHPEDFEPVDELFLLRYHPAVLTAAGAGYPMGHIKWLYHMMNTRCPLEEKMAVLWHQVFATSNSKVDNGNWMQKQIMTFRHYGMGNFQGLLIELAKDSAMIYWLDNNTNTKWSVNENWGGSCWSYSAWGWVTTPKWTCERFPEPSLDGIWNPLSPVFLTTGSSRGLSIGLRITTTLTRSSLGIKESSMVKTL